MGDCPRLKMIQAQFQKRLHNWCNETICYCCFTLSVMTLIACSGCTEEKIAPPQPVRPELKRAVEELYGHYRTSPPGKGWKISSIIAQGSQVLITVEIPPDQASLIMRQPAGNQFRLVAGQICPGKNEVIWSHLPAYSSVKVLPSVAGQVFIEVDCAH